MSLFLTILTAVGLSMDAFSLAIIYGTLNISKKIGTKMSITVSTFHFFMPIIGYILGKLLLAIVIINTNLLVGIIFIILSIEMILSIKKTEPIKLLSNLFSIIVFAFTVSLDSLSVGIAYSVLQNNIFISSLIFSLISGLFTYIGVNLGKTLVKKFGNKATLLGSIILLLLGLKYLL